MPDNSNYKIATADALTLLLHNQHAMGAAIEEITKWLCMRVEVRCPDLFVLRQEWRIEVDIHLTD